MNILLNFAFYLACISSILSCASDHNIKKDHTTDIAIQNYESTRQLIRNCVLNEPGADHPNLYAWNEEIDMRTINAMFCVDKLWNRCCTELIGKARNDIRNHLNQRFQLNQNIVPFFNTHGDMLAYAKNTFTLYVYTKNRLYKHELAKHDTVLLNNVYTLPIQYRNEENCEISDSIFIITLNVDSSFYTVIPTKTHTVYQPNIFNSDHCTPLLHNKRNKCIQKVFEHAHEKDINGNDLWDFSYDHNGILKLGECNLNQIKLDLENSFFDGIAEEWRTLQKMYLALRDMPCSCNHETYDNKCQEHYHTTCTILKDEHGLSLKRTPLHTFAQKHALHRVAMFNDSHIYTNALDDIIVKKDNQITNFINRKNTIPGLCYDLDTLRASAASHALEWKKLIGTSTVFYRVHSDCFEFLEIGSLTGSVPHKNTGKTRIKDTWAFKRKIIDTQLINYKKDGLIIALLDNNDPTKGSIFFAGSKGFNFWQDEYHRSDTSYVRNGIGEIHVLRKIFKSILTNSDAFDRKHAITVDIASALDFMNYIKTITNPLHDIPKELEKYHTYDDIDDYNSRIFYALPEDFIDIQALPVKEANQQESHQTTITMAPPAASSVETQTVPTAIALVTALVDTLPDSNSGVAKNQPHTAPRTLKLNARAHAYTTQVTQWCKQYISRWIPLMYAYRHTLGFLRGILPRWFA